jgi:hypothetical protein
MNPENNSQEPEAQLTESKAHVLHTVTPLSKYLALSLFILLPFVGGWIGYNYSPEKVVEVERVVVKEIVTLSAEEKVQKFLNSEDPTVQEAGIFLKNIQGMYDDRYAEKFPALTEIDNGIVSPVITYSSKEKIDYQIQLFEQAVKELESVEEVRVELLDEFKLIASEAKEIPEEYKEGFLSELEIMGNNDQLEANRYRTNALLDFYQAALSHHYFMKENFDYYEIQNEEIVFSSDSIVEEQYEESANKIINTYADYLGAEKALQEM